MQLEEFFEQQAAANPEVERQYALADAELQLALETARRRKAGGITQRQLADRMGVPQSVVGRFEVAGRSPGFGTLCRLADGLGVQIVIEPGYQVSVQPCPIRSAGTPNAALTVTDPMMFTLAAGESAETCAQPEVELPTTRAPEHAENTSRPRSRRRPAVSPAGPDRR